MADPPRAGGEDGGSQAAGEPFLFRLRVRYSECDLQGVLFNANYLAYIDHTITELWRAAFGGYTVMLDRGVDIVVAEVNMRFLGSARFDEEVVIAATVTTIGTTSVTTAFRFHRGGTEGPAGMDRLGGAGDLLLQAQIRHVFIDPATAMKTPMPDWAREGLAPWHVPAPEADRQHLADPQDPHDPHDPHDPQDPQDPQDP